MVSKEPTLTLINDFTVAGISVRTINQDEFNQTTAKLPHLWERFMADGIVDKIPSKIADSPVFGVYSDYESDFQGAYTVTAGVTIDTELTTPELSAIKINGGNYLVFNGQGIMPESIVDTWKRIWTYFDSETAYRRNYITDFELYRSPDEIEIYIGVVV